MIDPRSPNKEIFEQVAKDLNLPDEVVQKAYNSFWEFIRNTIKELPLKEELTEEQFATLRTNFNVPSLGKLSCTYARMVGVKARYKRIKIIK